MPDGSVVIPVYNGMPHLVEAVESALGQTGVDVEVLAVDDGSTDGSFAWLSAHPDPRVRAWKQENAGVAAARNFLLGRARAPVVAFLDNDDSWLPGKLAKQAALLARMPDVGLVYTDVAYVDAGGRPTGRVKAWRREGNVFADVLAARFIFTPSSVAVRRELLAAEKPAFRADVSGADDWDLWLRLARVTDVAVIPEALTRYRLHPAQASGRIDAIQEATRRTLARAVEETASVRDPSEARRLARAANEGAVRVDMRFCLNLWSAGRRREALALAIRAGLASPVVFLRLAAAYALSIRKQRQVHA